MKRFTMFIFLVGLAALAVGCGRAVPATPTEAVYAPVIGLCPGDNGRRGLGVVARSDAPRLSEPPAILLLWYTFSAEEMQCVCWSSRTNAE